MTTDTPTATATSTRTATSTSTKTKTATKEPTKTATRTPLPPGAVPPSKLSGTLPASAGLPVSGAARSRGGTSSNLLRDRNLATLWTSASTTPAEASATVKLDRSRSIGSIRWMWGLRYHGDRMHIEVSLDQIAWTTVATVGNAPTGVWQSLSVNAYTRYVRFRFENPERDTWLGGLAEVEVYAGPRVLPPPSTTPTPHPDGTIVNPGFERGAVAWSLEPGAAVVEITGTVVFDEALFRFLESAGFSESTFEGLGDGAPGGGGGPGASDDTFFGGPSVIEALETVEAEFATYEADPEVLEMRATMEAGEN